MSDLVNPALDRKDIILSEIDSPSLCTVMLVCLTCSMCMLSSHEIFVKRNSDLLLASVRKKMNRCLKSLKLLAFNH